jgi:3-oxo-5-alpha-steroid 4-dehydrogenase 1
LIDITLASQTWIVLALVLVPIQLRFAAPYGRHTRRGWGPMIDNRLGWIVMEIISPLTFGYFFLSGNGIKTPATWLFFALWMAHYLNRSIIFPMRIHTRGKKIPMSIAVSAMFFNIVNGYLNGAWLGTMGADYNASWLTDPRFIIGIAVFALGAGINLWSDNRLIHLRKPDETGYKIPQGGLFKYISCPNLFGEIVEWTGFAIMCWNWPALSFALWTAANLAPRALAHHRWYRSHFEAYPPKRKAVVPFVF